MNVEKVNGVHEAMGKDKHRGIWFWFAAAVAFIGGVIWSDTKHFHKVHYHISSEGKLTKDLTCVMLADLHNNCYGSGKRIEDDALYQAICEENPDIILIAGDMITARSKLKYQYAAEFVSALGKKFPVYYGLGNHEYRLRACTEPESGLEPEGYQYTVKYQQVMEQMKAKGVTILDNDKVDLPEYNLSIFGLTIPRAYYYKVHRKTMYVKDIEAAIGEADLDAYNILLAHNPEDFKAYANWGADLTCAGHNHGGLMRLPGLGGTISPRYVLFPRYDGGGYSRGKHHMILSRGLGQHTIPLRIFNPGELCIIHIDK